MTLIIKTFNTKTHRISLIGIITFSIETVSIMRFSIMVLRIKTLN